MANNGVEMAKTAKSAPKASSGAAHKSAKKPAQGKTSKSAKPSQKSQQKTQLKPQPKAAVKVPEKTKPKVASGQKQVSHTPPGPGNVGAPAVLKKKPGVESKSKALPGKDKSSAKPLGKPEKQALTEPKSAPVSKTPANTSPQMVAADKKNRDG